MVKLWGSLVMSALLLVAGSAHAQRTQNDGDRELLRLSARAESSEQHSRVADRLRDRATELEAQARRLDRAPRTLEQRRYPHEHKLPAVSQPGYKERRDARSARAQAREYRALAGRHLESASTVNVEPES